MVRVLFVNDDCPECGKCHGESIQALINKAADRAAIGDHRWKALSKLAHAMGLKAPPRAARYMTDDQLDASVVLRERGWSWARLSRMWDLPEWAVRSNMEKRGEKP